MPHLQHGLQDGNLAALGCKVQGCGASRVLQGALHVQIYCAHHHAGPRAEQDLYTSEVSQRGCHVQCSQPILCPAVHIPVRMHACGLSRCLSKAMHTPRTHAAHCPSIVWQCLQRVACRSRSIPRTGCIENGSESNLLDELNWTLVNSTCMTSSCHSLGSTCTMGLHLHWPLMSCTRTSRRGMRPSSVWILASSLTSILNASGCGPSTA